MINETFGDFFRRLRRSKGFKSQKHLSEVSGVSQATLSRLEDGSQKPSPTTLGNLAKALDIPYENLLGQAGYLSLGKPEIFDEGTGNSREMNDEEYEEYLQTIGEIVAEKNPFPSNINKTSNNTSDYKPSVRDHKDLKNFLEQSEIMFDGVPMTDEDKARIQGYMESMFWDAKQKNKRTKKDEK